MTHYTELEVLTGNEAHLLCFHIVKMGNDDLVLGLLICWKGWALESQRTKGTAEEQMRLILKSEIAIY